MRTAWRHFRADPTHFRSGDVINVIFGITDITPSFFSQRPQVKIKLILDVISNDPYHKNDTFLKRNGRKTSFKIGTMLHVYISVSMLHVYISVMVPDRLRVAIIDRQELIYSLSSHTMTCDLW